MRIAVEAALSPGSAHDASSGMRVLVGSAAAAARAQGHEIVFVGHHSALDAEFRGLGLSEDKSFTILDAPAVISPDEDPQHACREKPEASIMRAAEMVASNNARALVATSGVGATIAAALWHIKRLRGVLRPALACPIPTRAGTSLLIDAGANPDCKSWHILQFALMGSLYARHLMNITEPRIGLLAPEMDGAGTSGLVHETLPLLKYAGLRFDGAVSGRDVATGKVDVIVAEGCTGDICRRLYEGLSRACFEMLESELRKNAVSRLGLAVFGGAVGRISGRMELTIAGGSPILGLNAPVVLCRRTDFPEAVAESIRTAAALADSDINERIRGRLEDVKSEMETARKA